MARTGYATDAGVNKPESMIILPDSSNVVAVWSDYASTLWTASGAKIMEGEFFYETP